MKDHVRSVLSELEQSERSSFDLALVSEWVQLSPATLAKQVRRGKIKARRDGKRYLLSKSEVRHIVEKNRSMLLGWNRLVDVTNELAFHRNIGESVCRKLELEKALDMNGHCRISPAAEAALRAWHNEKCKHDNWKRKTALAAELELDPRVVDNLCRKLNLEIDHDIHGYVILSDVACEAITQWKGRRDRKRLKTRVAKGTQWYSLRKTAEDSAVGLMSCTAPEYDHLVETYYRRFLLWMRNGLRYETFDGVRYFEQDVHDRLVDDLCVIEAARIGGVGVSTVKGWLTKGQLGSSDYFGCRRSISRKGYYALLRRQYAQSPRLRKKELVPVKILDPIPAIVKKAGFADVDELVAAVERETGIPEKELIPLRHETGFVHRAVKNTLDKWMLLAEQGVPLDLLPDDVVGVELPELPGNVLRKRLLRMVSTYLQKETGEVYDLVFGDPDGMPEDVRSLVELVRAHAGAQVYSPLDTYTVGDLLVHPSGGDFGFVTDAENPRAIQVAWQRDFGTVTMAQNVESDYGAHDMPVLALH